MGALYSIILANYIRLHHTTIYTATHCIMPCFLHFHTLLWFVNSYLSIVLLACIYTHLFVRMYVFLILDTVVTLNLIQ